jgi:hypothetical protein
VFDQHGATWQGEAIIVMVEQRPEKHAPLALPWSWHRRYGWRGHFDRMCRWHDRLLRADTRDDVEDYLYAFFQTCSTLRDWLPSDLFPPEEVKRLFSETVEMRLCRDIANTTKHRRLRHSVIGQEPALAREYVGRDRGRFDDYSDFIVLSKGEKYDLRDVASRCLNLCAQFIAGHAERT